MFYFLSPAIYFQEGKQPIRPHQSRQPSLEPPAGGSVLDPLDYLQQPMWPGLPKPICPPTSPKFDKVASDGEVGPQVSKGRRPR